MPCLMDLRQVQNTLYNDVIIFHNASKIEDSNCREGRSVVAMTHCGSTSSSFDEADQRSRFAKGTILDEH